MATFNVTIEDTGETYRCSGRQSLLVGMEALGKKGIPVGCRGGGCGVCKIEVTAGEYQKHTMSREHVSVEDEADGRLLSCRVNPASDVKLKVVGKMKKNVCRLPDVAGVAGAAGHASES